MKLGLALLKDIILSEKWHKKSRKPFKDFLLNVPLVGSGYLILKI